MRVDNSAESGATAGDETAVTEANSGGASGTAWSDVIIGTGATFAYDNAQAMHGTWSYRHATGATSAQSMLIWTSAVLGSPARLWVRFYLRLSALTNQSVCRIRSGTTQVLRVQVDGAGQVELRQADNTVAGDSGANVLSAGVWYRFEVDARPGTLTNEVRVYVGDTMTEAIPAVAAAGVYSAAATADEFTAGNAGAGPNVPDGWFDSLAASDVGWIGPVTVEPTVVAGGVAAEADTARAGAAVKSATGGPGAEADAAPSGAGWRTAVGSAAAEADTAVAGVGDKFAAGALTTETDTGTAGAGIKSATGAPSAETDTAQAGVVQVLGAASTAAETDTARPGAGQRLAVGGQAGEMDTAPAGAGAKTAVAGRALEGNFATAGTVVVTPSGSVATETDTALAGTGGKTAAAGRAAQADAALTGSGLRSSGGLPAGEVDLAVSGTVLVLVVVAGVPADETDLALVGSGRKTFAGGRAGETDQALAAALRIVLVSPMYTLDGTTTASSVDGTTTKGVRTL